MTDWSFFSAPFESLLTNTYWGTIDDLYEVVDIYGAGQIRPEIEALSLDDALEAYRRLEASELSVGRSSSRTRSGHRLQHVIQSRGWLPIR